MYLSPTFCHTLSGLVTHVGPVCLLIAEWCKQERQKEKEREAQQQKEREEAEEKRAQTKARHKEAVTAFQALLEEKVNSSEVSFRNPKRMNAFAQRKVV